MKLPLKVSRYTPTLDMHMHVRRMATDALAEKAGTEPRNVKRWREVESCPQMAAARDLAEALEIPLGELANMLAAGFDALKETQKQLAVRWYGAVLSHVESLSDVSETMRDDLSDLAERAKRLGKKKLTRAPQVLENPIEGEGKRPSAPVKLNGPAAVAKRSLIRQLKMLEKRCSERKVRR